MEKIVQKAPAKVNLALHVAGRRPDGYHELDSIVAFVPDVADTITLVPAREFRLHVSGARAAGVPADESNLALRAAMALPRRWPEHFAPVDIRLEKNLPAAAGIGGGSADAAAVIRAMCRLHGFFPPWRELQALALELGADVPVCLHGRAARMRGIGERLTSLSMPRNTWALLANPGVKVSTAAVFARLRASSVKGFRALPPTLPRQWMHTRALAADLARLRNDLQPPACALAAQIAHCLQQLRREPGVLLTRMSGSGATCLALFDNAYAARRACRRLREKHPRWWLAMGLLR